MYTPLQSFIIRTPKLSISYLHKDFFDKAILDPQVQEAIYIASHVLYTELQKYLSKTITDKGEKQRIELSLYRYISRMSSRCTPFGLFAGCSTGHIVDDKTNIELGDYSRYTRLDMYFLCTLSQELSKLQEVKEKIRYYPNTSLYQLGNKYRYIEYKYIKNRRIHHISSVDRSVYLDIILKSARKGVRVNELKSCLVDRDINQDEAKEFIEDLIDSQILVNELSPSVTGDDYFAQIISILEELNINDALLSSLKEFQKMLLKMDESFQGIADLSFAVPAMTLYQQIIQKIKEINIPYEEKYLFQVDLTRNTVEATLGKDIVDELQSTMTFLNKINFAQKNETLQKFQEVFYKRYEDREVPIMEALDTEIGIGYPADKGVGDISPLLDNFFVFGQASQTGNFQTNAFYSVLLKKAIEAVKQNEKEIVFDDDDVKNFKTNWEDLPPTIQSMIEIIKSDSGNPLIYLSGFSGVCGANLLARFSHTDENINKFVDEITTKEQELMPYMVLAEIAHLPDSRVGNILSRPHIRDYEILYLANSDLQENRLIYMSDLYLSIRQGRICLRSKKLNKEIVPRLTNAHNYRNNPMPVYRFLCDMQHQQGRTGLYFNWGYLSNELNYLPRVRYKNTILSLATWKIKISEIKHLFTFKDDEKLLIETAKWREKDKLPQKMQLKDGDNELLVDWDNAQSIRALFSIIKKRDMITLTEFLYDPENSVVRDENGNPYLNECIVVFYKDSKK